MSGMSCSSGCGELKRHEGTTQERQFKCRKCGKSFSESGGLKKHKGTLNWGNFMRGLTRERTKAIQVLQMWQYFSLSNNLRNHYRTLTVEKLSVQGLAWASQDQVTLRKMKELHRREAIFVHKVWKEVDIQMTWSNMIVWWEDSHRREDIQVHQMWQ